MEVTMEPSTDHSRLNQLDVDNISSIKDIELLQDIFKKSTDMRERSALRTAIQQLRVEQGTVQTKKRASKRISRRLTKLIEMDQNSNTIYQTEEMNTEDVEKPKHTNDDETTIMKSKEKRNEIISPDQNEENSEIRDDSVFIDEANGSTSPFVRNSTVRRNTRSKRSTRSSAHTSDSRKSTRSQSIISGEEFEERPNTVKNQATYSETKPLISPVLLKKSRENDLVSGDVIKPTRPCRRHNSDIVNFLEDFDAASPISPYKSPSVSKQQLSRRLSERKTSNTFKPSSTSSNISVSYIQGATCQYKTISTSFRDPSKKSPSESNSEDSTQFNTNNNNKEYNQIVWRHPSSSNTPASSHFPEGSPSKSVESTHDTSIDGNENLNHVHQKHSARVILKALSKKLFSTKGHHHSSHHSSPSNSSISSTGSTRKISTANKASSHVKQQFSESLPPPSSSETHKQRHQHNTGTTNSRLKTHSSHNSHQKSKPRSAANVYSPSPISDRKKIFEQAGHKISVSANFGHNYNKPSTSGKPKKYGMAEVITRTQTHDHGSGVYAGERDVDETGSPDERPEVNNNDVDNDSLESPGEDIGESTIEELDSLLRQYTDHDKRLKIRDTIRQLKENLEEGDRKPTRPSVVGRSNAADYPAAVSTPSSDSTVTLSRKSLTEENSTSLSSTPVSRFIGRSTSLKNPKPSYQPPTEAVYRASSFKLSRPKDFIPKKGDSTPQLSEVPESDSLQKYSDTLNNNITKFRVPVTKEPVTYVTSTPCTANTSTSYNKTASPFSVSPKSSFKKQSWVPPSSVARQKSHPPTTPRENPTRTPILTSLKRSESSKENRSSDFGSIPIVQGNVRRSKSILGRILGQKIGAERTPPQEASITFAKTQIRTPSILELEISTVTPYIKDTLTSPVEQAKPQISTLLTANHKSDISHEYESTSEKSADSVDLEVEQLPVKPLSGSRSTSSSSSNDISHTYLVEDNRFSSEESDSSEPEVDSLTLSDIVKANEGNESLPSTTGPTNTFSTSESAEDLIDSLERSTDEEVKVQVADCLTEDDNSKLEESEQAVQDHPEVSEEIILNPSEPAENTDLPEISLSLDNSTQENLNYPVPAKRTTLIVKKSAAPTPNSTTFVILPPIQSHVVCETETVQLFNVEIIPPTPGEKVCSSEFGENKKETKDNSSSEIKETEFELPEDNKETEDKSSNFAEEEEVFLEDSEVEEDEDTMDRYSSRALQSRVSVKSQILATEDINGNHELPKSKKVREVHSKKPLTTGEGLKSRIQKYKGQLNGDVTSKPPNGSTQIKRNGSIRVPGSTGAKLNVSRFEKGNENIEITKDSKTTSITVKTTAPVTSRITSVEEKVRKSSDPEKKEGRRNRRTASSNSSTDNSRKSSTNSQGDDTGNSRRSRRARDVESGTTAEKSIEVKENGSAKLEKASIDTAAELKGAHDKKYGSRIEINTKASRERKSKDTAPTTVATADAEPVTVNIEATVEDSLSDWSSKRRRKREKKNTEPAPSDKSPEEENKDPVFDDRTQNGEQDDSGSKRPSQPVRTHRLVRHSAPSEDFEDSLVDYSIKFPRDGASKTPDLTTSEESPDEVEQKLPENEVVTSVDVEVEESSKFADKTTSPAAFEPESGGPDLEEESDGRQSDENSVDDQPEVTGNDDVVDVTVAKIEQGISESGDVKEESVAETTEEIKETSQYGEEEESEEGVATQLEIDEMKEEDSQVCDISEQIDQSETEFDLENKASLVEDKSVHSEVNEIKTESDSRESIEIAEVEYKSESDATKPQTTAHADEDEQSSTKVIDPGHNSTRKYRRNRSRNSEPSLDIDQPQDKSPEIEAPQTGNEISKELKVEEDDKDTKESEQPETKRHRRHHKDRKHTSETSEEVKGEERSKKKHHLTKEPEVGKEAETVKEKHKHKHHKHEKTKDEESKSVESEQPKKTVLTDEKFAEDRTEKKSRRHKDKHSAAEKDSVKKLDTAKEEKEAESKKEKQKPNKEETKPEAENSKPEVEAPKTMHFNYENVETITDMNLLERMLECAEEYEYRRRIRSVLRALKRGEKPNVIKDNKWKTRGTKSSAVVVKDSSPKPGDLARRGMLPREGGRDSLVSRTAVKTSFTKTETSSLGSKSVSIKTERSKMTTGTKKIGSIFDRGDDDDNVRTSSRTSGSSSRLADFEKRQAERKRELQRNRSMPTSSSKDARKAFVAKLEAEAPKTGNKKVGRSPTFVVPNANNVKQLLLKWCQSKTRGYEHVDIMNFSGSWASGMAFCALVHNFFPQAFDYSELDPKNRAHNFDLAFNSAEKFADVSPLLEVEDMLIMGNRPDSKCVFTYVQFLYNHLRKYDKPLGPLTATQVVVKKKLTESEDL